MSFTIAHSITISLAVLGIITLPSRFVEAVIAFSIVYVALENIFRKEIRHRWGLTFIRIHPRPWIRKYLKRNEYPKRRFSSSACEF